MSSNQDEVTHPKISEKAMQGIHEGALVQRTRELVQHPMEKEHTHIVKRIFVLQQQQKTLWN